jgi:predicted enzyme involved in methoxymalonyl-ACP biosynthesis
MPYADKLINKLITKNKNSKMTKVTNKLNLTEGSNEDVILGAIDKLINVKNQSEEIATELQEKLTIAQQEASTANEKIAELQTQLDAITLTAKEAEELSAETIASEMVNKFTSKIGNKAETIATWVKLAKADLEGTKNLLEELPLNKVANKIDSVQSQTNIVGTYAQSKMLEIANKHNQK